jgi:hypothetical protein
MIADTDQGTVLRSDNAALTMDAKGETHLYLPQADHDATVPKPFLAMVAMFIRWQRDAEWRADLLQWMQEQQQS